MDVVNIVAVGSLGFEVDIAQLSDDLNLPVSNYDEEFNASYFRVNEDGELIVLYTSGKYTIRGGGDFDSLYRTNSLFVSHLSELGLEIGDPNLDIKNVVTVGDLERELNLEALSISLGLERVEYEPEQFPGLVYRPSDDHLVLLIFSSGKVVITGGETKSENQGALDGLEKKISKIQ